MNGNDDQGGTPTPTEDNSNQTALFFEALFNQKPANEKILIWTLPDKYSRWMETAASAAYEAIKIERAGAFNVYVGLSTSNTDLGPALRGRQNSVASMFCVWADVDINGPGHKSDKGAPNEAAAMQLIDNIGVAPSMVVFSGGGIHAYWLFKKPWTFETDADRTDAYAFSTAWQRTIQAHADAIGFKVDGTFDLSRVLRVPGTHNRKKELTAPIPCVIRTLTDVRYDPAELREFLTPETRKASKGVGADDVQTAIESGGFRFDFGKSQIDMERFDMLCEVEPRFKGSWERKRDTAAWKNATASEFDMSLASFAVAAEWPDQEIINLLIAARRKFKDDMKRPEYYARTLLQAKTKYARAVAMDSAKRQAVSLPLEMKTITDESGATVQPTEQEIGDAERKKNLDDISSILGTHITSVIKYNQDPPKYRLNTSRGGIELGEVDRLINQGPLRNAIAAATGHYMPKIKADEWDFVAQLLLFVCEIVETGPETTDIGAMRSWLIQYLDEQVPGDMAQANIANQTPVKKIDEPAFVYFWLGHFRKWLDVRESEKLSTKAAGLLLRKFGCAPMPVAFKIDSPTGEPADVRYTTRNVWRVCLDDLHGLPPGHSNGNGRPKAPAAPTPPAAVNVAPESAPRTPIASHAGKPAAPTPPTTPPTPPAAASANAPTTIPQSTDATPGGQDQRRKSPGKRPPATRPPKAASIVAPVIRGDAI